MYGKTADEIAMKLHLATLRDEIARHERVYGGAWNSPLGSAFRKLEEELKNQHPEYF